jgi:hypothetical protein
MLSKDVSNNYDFDFTQAVVKHLAKGQSYTFAVEAYYEYTEIKDGKEVSKSKWGTGLDLSSVVVGQEAKGGNTTYITINGEEKAYDFSGTIKAVENNDTSKDNEEHRALMLRALFKVAQEEGVTDFNVVMCMGLDKYKSDKNIESMKKGGCKEIADKMLDFLKQYDGLDLTKLENF